MGFPRLSVTVSAAVSLLSLIAPASSAQDAQPTGELLASQVNETLGLTDSVVFSLDVTGEPGDEALFVLPIEGVDFTLQTWPHSVRSEHYRVLAQVADGSLVEVPASEVRTLRGVVTEVPGSTAAGAFEDDGGLFARVHLPGLDSGYWVEQLVDRFPGADPALHVVYRDADVLHGHGVCGSEALPDPSVPDTHGSSFAGVGDCGGLCLAELGCDADFEYYQDYGSNVNTVQNRINSIINTMNQQYESEVGIRHDITTIVVRTTSNDPYTGSNPSSLLNQVQNQWTGPLAGTPHDVTQLFTGKNMQGSTIGVANLGAICSPNRYSVVENFTGNFSCLTDLSAHELGHNWNAGHCSCGGFTMNPSITCANRFTNGTEATISSYRAFVSPCLGSEGPPQADFVANPTNGDAPHPVQFTDTTTGTKSSWFWDFGDGNTSTQQNPSHTYTMAGTFDVSLSVSGSDGSDSTTKVGFIDVTPPVTQFTDLGGGAPGVLGVPELSASGPLFAGEQVNVNLVSGSFSSTALAWLSFASSPVNAFGGTIFANPPSAQLFFSTNGFGALFLNTSWPAGLPPGTELYIQFLIADPLAQDGVSVSNGITATTL